MAGRDITEGRSTRAIAVDVGIVSNNAIWQNTKEAYDVAIGGQPFFYAMNDQRPYMRETAPFRKDQFDNSSEPGEQSLTGWWIRSQSSFHGGEGIKFYDPSSGETVNYRYTDSKGVDVWTKGEVTLLNATSSAHFTTGPIKSNGKPFQSTRSIKWSNTNGILLWDEYDVDKISLDGTETHFLDYNTGTDYPVYAICDDGVNAYWVTNVLNSGTPRLRVYKKPLTGSAASTADIALMISDNSITVSEGVMEYVKDRIVMAINNKIYEISTSASSLPSAAYTHTDTDLVFTSVTASGTAIYVAGYSGIQSFIYKFTLDTSGVMPTLTSAITAAEMPVGERIYSIYYYLGFMAIGTNKGVRVAQVDDNGDVLYGPLIFESTQPVYAFAARDSYIWCASGVDGEPGVIRVDLNNQIEPLRFAYANDLYVSGISGFATTGCAFAGDTNRLIFVTTAVRAGTVTNKQLTDNVAILTTAATHNLTVGESIWVEGVDATFNGPHIVSAVSTATTLTFAKTAGNVISTAVTAATAVINRTGSINIESAGEKTPSGYLTTGYIRYNTLEPKNFKRLLGRGNFDYGSLTLETVDKAGIEYDLISYGGTVAPVEVTTNQPADAQEYIAYKFLFFRDADDNTKGPVFQGYQAKATIATPRQRIIQFPVFNYDTETDRYNVQTGYEGRALERLAALENLEQDGDVVTWQDLTTGESRQVVIEKISFTRETPPDKRFSGFGGVITMTIRTV